MSFLFCLAFWKMSSISDLLCVEIFSSFGSSCGVVDEWVVCWCVVVCPDGLFCLDVVCFALLGVGQLLIELCLADRFC